MHSVLGDIAFYWGVAILFSLISFVFGHHHDHDPSGQVSGFIFPIILLALAVVATAAQLTGNIPVW